MDSDHPCDLQHLSLECSPSLMIHNLIFSEYETLEMTSESSIGSMSQGVCTSNPMSWGSNSSQHHITKEA